jgi:DNA (cytosine-5)-methyltransferase 1
MIPVIDIFAGPGGLGEGFSVHEQDGAPCFEVALSIEKDPVAVETLRLRKFFRQFPKNEVPEIYYEVLRGRIPVWELPGLLKDQSPLLFEKWRKAESEAVLAELGISEDSHQRISQRIAQAIGSEGKPWVLIGGPPCQAYSLAGRVRNLGKPDYRIEDDKRSSLYREYLRIISEHRPAVFVMENVKGLLSATFENQQIFDNILKDLRNPNANGTFSDRSLRYRITAVANDPGRLFRGDLKPRDFVVECEKYGIPQQRHRVILIGINEDLGDVDIPSLRPSVAPSVRETIGGLPKLRSGLSRDKWNGGYVRLADHPDTWMEAIRAGVRENGDDAEWLKELGENGDVSLKQFVKRICQRIESPQFDRGSEFVKLDNPPQAPESLRNWLIDERLNGVCNHSARSHLVSDLIRYLFASCYAHIHGTSPRLEQFPESLLPEHANARSHKFNDRFRVQVADAPSSTITSHISKDGHYFIHYDPSQCRSLTVREAARLQTFPDNYFFCGPRTSQYVQVGNAVPPWLSVQIAESVWQALVNSGSV